MQQRPTSVTVIAWILIALGGISLISSILAINDPKAKELMGHSPIPIWAQFIHLYLGILIGLISGMALLKGLNWARFLYLIFTIIGFVIGFAFSTVKLAMIPGAILSAVIIFFLFRPRVNDYFAGREAQPVPKVTIVTSPEKPVKLWRKISSIIFYVISGYFFYMTCVIAFVNKPWIFVKSALIGGFGFIGLLFLVIGLVFVGFKNWQRMVGIVSICVAGFVSFGVLVIAFLLLIPEYKKLFSADFLPFFDDYVSGAVFTGFFGLLGLLLIIASTKQAKYFPALDNNHDGGAPPVAS